MMVTTANMPSPVAVLHACGWLAGGVDPPRVEDLSSSHSVYRATRSDGAEVIVKMRRADGRRGLSNELFVYRMAGWSEALGSVVAQPVYVDECAELLVLEALPGLRLHWGRMSEPGFMRRVGGALAIVHRATLGQPIPVSGAAGILEVADRPEATGLDRPPQTQALMRRIAGDALLADALRAAKAGYRVRCLIHGDLRPEHWMELPDGSLRLIDWEMGGGGDPMLDLASAMVEPALEAIRWGRPQRDWTSEVLAALEELTAGYRDCGGLAAVESTAGRVQLARLGAARLLHVACEWADAGMHASSVDALVDAARRVLFGLDRAERLAA